MVQFKFNIPPGAEEAWQREREEAQGQLRRELAAAVDELHRVQAAGDVDAVRTMETRVLTGLLVRAQTLGVAFPKGLRAALKVEDVTWAGEPALQHLEALGFRRPTSKKKLAFRVQTFVRNLILDGKGDSVPDELFQLRMTFFVGFAKK